MRFTKIDKAKKEYEGPTIRMIVSNIKGLDEIMAVRWSCIDDINNWQKLDHIDIEYCPKCYLVLLKGESCPCCKVKGEIL